MELLIVELRKDGKRHRIDAALFRQLIDVSLIPIIGSLAAGSLVALAQWYPGVPWRRGSDQLVTFWICTLFAVTGFRLWLIRRCRARIMSLGYNRPQAVFYSISTGLSGLVWGAGGLFVHNAAPMALVITITAVQAMVMGGVMTLGAFMPAFLAFAIPAILPMTVLLALDGQLSSTILAVYSFIFLVLMVGIARHFNTSLRRTWQLTFDKEDLVKALTQAHEQTLMAEQQRLSERERMEAMLRHWMADNSHEMRTPVAVLRAQIEAFQDGIYTVDAKRLESLHGQVMGLARLVEDQYTLARSDIGQLECHSDSFQILDLLDDVVGTFSGRYTDAGLRIEWAGFAAPGPTILGDEVRIRQVFSNVLENALRYTDAGGALEISWAMEGDLLTLRFDDTAPGIPEEALAKLFERFYRVDSSRNRGKGGAGLGLCLCRSFIEAHKGTIEASNSPLGGLRITIQLPSASLGPYHIDPRMGQGHPLPRSITKVLQ